MSDKLSDEQRLAIRLKIKSLEETLTRVLYDDLTVIQTIRNLKAKIGMYHTEFDESGCVYCSG